MRSSGHRTNRHRENRSVCPSDVARHSRQRATRCKEAPLALILAPTRELASQIFEDIRQYSQETSIRSTCIFGGANQNPQIRRLEKGAEILVATPGRLMDLEAQGFLSLSAVQYLVLDEADRLLDMGFIGDIRKIAAMLPENRQTALFSATMSKEIRALSAFLLNQPQQVSVTPKQVAVAKITQHKLAVPTAKKQEALHQLLNRDAVRKVIVFTRTKHASERVTKKLLKAGFSASAINGNKSQNARTRALERFKKVRTGFWWRPTWPLEALIFAVLVTSLTLSSRKNQKTMYIASVERHERAKPVSPGRWWTKQKRNA